MKKINLLAALLTTLSFASQAQTKTNLLSGTILDNQQKAVSAATISLLHPKDSSLVKSTVSDEKGSYSFENVSTGKYLVMVSAVGFEKTYSQLIQSSEKELKLPAISIKPVSKELTEVTVVGKKAMVEQKIDRMVVNVDAAVSNAGTTALEVLEKSPGVQVDKDGNISLKGKQGVMILIDGRPSYLSGPELANMLKGMQSSQLDQIEIMTNPPAKYDASGNSGVINIKTKKNKMKGFNGNFTVGGTQGSYFRTNESLSLNYRNQKINLFSNFSFAINTGFQELDILRRYKENDHSLRAIFEQTSLMRNERMNNNAKIGMDYFLSKKTTIGFVASGFYNPSKETGYNTSFLKNPEAVVDSIVQANSLNDEKWKNGSINLNLRHQIDSTGKELTADFDYLRYEASSIQEFTNTTFRADWVKKYEEKLKGDLPNTFNIYSAKMDYTHPFKKETKLEAGFKISHVETENRANYFELINGVYEPDYRKTNFFDYEEDIIAAYINFNKQLTKKLGVQTGLRFENTKYSGFQYGNPTQEDSSFTRSYNSWFPTVYFSYKADKNNQFGLSVGRRIDRPRYHDLNPFLFFLDKYTYGQGNPYLKPQYSNNLEVSHIFKEFLTTTLNYSVTNDMFVETFDQPQQNGDDYNYATVVKRGNIGKRQNAGIAVNVQMPVKSWWTAMIYSNYNYSKFEGPVNGEMVKAEAGNLMFNVNNQFKFKKGWSAELSGWYRTKGIEGQLIINPMGQLNMGISKQVLKSKGTIKLNVRDLFYTTQAQGYIKFKSTEAEFNNRWDSRSLNLTFSYRFGKQMNGNGNGQRKKGGANEEQNRVSSGD